MPVSLTDAQRTALRSNAIKVRTLIDLYLDSGRASFWDGAKATEFDGATYVACADFGEVSEISLGLDLGAAGIELKLNGTRLQEASPDPLDPGALFGTIEDENYQLRRVTVRFAFFDGETGAAIKTITRFAGFIDQIQQVEQADDDGNMIEWLIVKCESIARRYGVRGARTRSHDDQQDIWSSDTFFKFTSNSASKAGTLPWGRAGVVTTGIGGGIGAGAGRTFGDFKFRGRLGDVV